MKALLHAAVWAAGFVTVIAAPAHAAGRQTWVSGTGADFNPCSRTAPCATFAAALDQTLPGGEIRVLDAGEFGPVTIDRSISIVGNRRGGSIINCGCSGIFVDAGEEDVVSIRGLQIEGAEIIGYGIGVAQVGSLYVSDTVIRGFKDIGIGIAISTAAPMRAYLNRVQLVENDIGIYVAPASSTEMAVTIDSSVVESNTLNPLYMAGPDTIVTVGNSRLATTETIVEDGASLVSLGNNFIIGATPTETVTLK